MYKLACCDKLPSRSDRLAFAIDSFDGQPAERAASRTSPRPRPQDTQAGRVSHTH